MPLLTGHCMCGAVTWSYSGEITRNLVCNCTDCQRATSAPLTAYVGMKPEQLTWAGEIMHYESSTKIFRGFCPSCGTRLYYRSDRWPDVHVHAATMTNPSEYQPSAQVMMRSRANWLDQLETLPAHEGFQQDPLNQPPAEVH